MSRPERKPIWRPNRVLHDKDICMRCVHREIKSCRSATCAKDKLPSLNKTTWLYDECEHFEDRGAARPPVKAVIYCRVAAPKTLCVRSNREWVTHVSTVLGERGGGGFWRDGKAFKRLYGADAAAAWKKVQEETLRRRQVEEEYFKPRR